MDKGPPVKLYVLVVLYGRVVIRLEQTLRIQRRQLLMNTHVKQVLYLIACTRVTPRKLHRTNTHVHTRVRTSLSEIEFASLRTHATLDGHWWKLKHIHTYIDHNTYTHIQATRL